MQSYHAGQVDVGQTADQGLTQAGELQVQGLVLLLDLFVLLLHVLQVLFHRRDLQEIRGHRKDKEMFRITGLDLQGMFGSPTATTGSSRWSFILLCSQTLDWNITSQTSISPTLLNMNLNLVAASASASFT